MRFRWIQTLSSRWNRTSRSSPPKDIPTASNEPLILAEEPSEKSDRNIQLYDQARAMDDARKDFAGKLFWLLAAVLVGGFGLVATTRLTKIAFADAKDLFFSVFTAILAIVSSVVGYYFGRAEGEKDR